MSREPKAESLRQRAIALLARREHSRSELRIKLSRVCDDASLIEEVLDGLAVSRLQSDERHAFGFARQRASRGYGPVRILQELRERGVSRELCRQAIDGLGADWVAIARAARTKRFGGQLPGDGAARAAQGRFLLHRGFSADTVRRCLTSHGDPAADIVDD